MTTMAKMMMKMMTKMMSKMMMTVHRPMAERQAGNLEAGRQHTKRQASSIEAC
jgi:high-affinity Fe2+/Pb2+ permease